MSSGSIEFENVWKVFRRHSGRMLLRAHLSRRIGPRQDVEQFVALKNVSFAIKPGEGVAVVGSNGAGKSTLLSIMAGLVAPDRGSAEVWGRVVPLLDLGAGFHPDLTGAENVRLNAALLGISRRQIQESFQRVVEFSELGDFIDEPLRTYSAGMMMRLAFSVAVNVDPDIILIDEVLAVGDAAFQAKCIDRIFDFRRRGRTLVCVSHVSGMIRELCNRAIWLDHGDVMLDGPISEVMDAYDGRLRSNS